MFVIMNAETTKLYRKPRHLGPALYPSERGARIAASRMNTEAGKTLWVALSNKEYLEMHPVKMVQRVNLVSGETYMEAEDTPLCCSPASETYWSM